MEINAIKLIIMLHLEFIYFEEQIKIKNTQTQFKHDHQFHSKCVFDKKVAI